MNYNKSNRIIPKIFKEPKSRLVFLIVLFFSSVYFLPTVYLHKVSFFVFFSILIFPYLSKIYQWFARSSYYSKVAIGFLSFSVFIKVLPGGYFPPFFGGIAGWTYQNQPSNEIVMGGLQLVRKDGERIWFSNGFISPQNFIYRQVNVLLPEDETAIKLFEYYLKLYSYHYPYLQKDHFANQRFLGKFTYPGHNPYKVLNYKDFPTESLDSFQIVTEKYDKKTKKLIERSIWTTYVIKDRKLVRGS
jgi:hypothetical protein